MMGSSSVSPGSQTNGRPSGGPLAGDRSERPAFNPFPGLRPFGPSDAHLFFGREQHIEALLAKLSNRRLCAVVGTSGSGKSSLVLAGVLPRLERGYRTRLPDLEGHPVARSAWRIARMRPGGDPIGHLASALYDASRDEEEDLDEASLPPGQMDDAVLAKGLIEGQLRHSQRGLIEAARALPLSAGENLLVIVDQFEELFRFRQRALLDDPVQDPATAFVRLLLRASEEPSVPIFVMITMRSDYIGECVQIPGLPEALNDGQFLLPQLDRDERERAIRGPMAVARAAIAKTLVQHLLNRVGDMTEQLPVLQHALMRSFDLWQTTDPANPRLEATHYERAGGLEEALARHADEALSEVEAELGERGRRIAEALFRALVERDQVGRDVRRPGRVRDLLAAADTDLATLSKVVARFTGPGRGFLVVHPGEQPLSADAWLDITHEALLRLWPRMREWCAREAELAQRLCQLRDAERRHREGLAGLWRDPELSLAVEWMAQMRPTNAQAARYGVELERVQGFLDESSAAEALAREDARDAQVLRRFRKMFTAARTSTLMGLLSLPLVLILHGSGLLDGMWAGSTRFKLLSTSARSIGVVHHLHQHLALVTLDDQTLAALSDQTRLGEQLGPSGSRWRLLQADVLRRLSEAGARVVAYDVSFSALAAPSALERAGTQALVEAITKARARGTSVVITASAPGPQGGVNTEPAIRAALTAPGPSGLGFVASPCLGVARDGGAVFEVLSTSHPWRPLRPSLPLAAVAAFWRTPDVFVDSADRTLFLRGQGGQREVRFADFDLVHGSAQTAACKLLEPGDRLSRQIVDLCPRLLQRGDEGVVPFEQVLSGELSPGAVAGKIVIVGEQRRDYDSYAVMRCGSTPWSCRVSDSWGANLHLDAASNLLRGRAIRPVESWLQLAIIALMCIAVAWQRMRLRDRGLAVRVAALSLLIAIDLALVMASAILFEVLMDEAYHVLAMVTTHLVVGRLDKH